MNLIRKLLGKKTQITSERNGEPERRRGVGGTLEKSNKSSNSLESLVRQFTLTRACSHYRKPSTINAKLMNATNMTSSFSNREKRRRNPLSRRNSRSISLRRVYRARSYSHGVRRLCLGGTTGTYPKSTASCRVSSPSYARSINRWTECGIRPKRCSNLRPSGASWAWPGDRPNVIAVRASAATR